MMRFVVSDENDAATLHCEFCNLQYEWPFVVHVYWEGTDGPGKRSDPDVSHVIWCHWSKDENLSKLGFRECPEIARWRNTEWQLFDLDRNVERDRGKVIVTAGRLTFG